MQRRGRDACPACARASHALGLMIGSPCARPQDYTLCHKVHIAYTALLPGVRCFRYILSLEEQVLRIFANLLLLSCSTLIYLHLLAFSYIYSSTATYDPIPAVSIDCTHLLLSIKHCMRSGSTYNRLLRRLQNSSPAQPSRRDTTLTPGHGKHPRFDSHTTPRFGTPFIELTVR